MRLGCDASREPWAVSKWPLEMRVRPLLRLTIKVKRMSMIFEAIGMIVCVVGGGALGLFILGLLLGLACEVWVLASGKFRGVLRGESLIYEYKKNREQFLKWKQEQDI